MKNQNRVFLVLVGMVLAACGSNLKQQYTGTKSDQYGSAQLTLILTQSGDTVTGTWTATGTSNAYNYPQPGSGTTTTGTNNVNNQSTYEAGSLSGTIVDGKILQNVVWTSNNMSGQYNYGGSNMNCGSSSFTGTIQIGNSGETLNGILMAQNASNVDNQTCYNYNRNVVINLTATQN